MLAAAVLQVLAVWLDWLGLPASAAGPAWGLVHGTLQLVIGGVLVWLACVWGLVQSLKNRLLAMLHIGFLWLGLAFLLGGLSRWLAWGYGMGTLGLGALHALTMGCLASLMLAMVTRVSCGHSGRALVADHTAWTLFWLLQVATVLRIAAEVPGVFGMAWVWVLPVAAFLWGRHHGRMGCAAGSVVRLPAGRRPAGLKKLLSRTCDGCHSLAFAPCPPAGANCCAPARRYRRHGRRADPLAPDHPA